MGRNTSGVKGIRLKKGDSVVGMVVTDPDATLLTVCEQGYGKRTWFGPGDTIAASSDAEEADNASGDAETKPAEEQTEEPNSSQSYRTQRRGGGGLMDIKASKRNGPVIGIVPVTDEDELLMMTARGKIQRVAAKEIGVIGRNTQGVRIMKVDEGDTLTAIVKVPKEDAIDAEADTTTSSPDTPATEASPASPPVKPESEPDDSVGPGDSTDSDLPE